jgi:phosphatidylethanolamine-binding protein (PEBP) family uncharacterized protein/Spy/CpxP family protein refolding chaperone
MLATVAVSGRTGEYSESQNIMKAKVILLALALGASNSLVTAQDANPPGEERRSAPRKGARPEETEPLTDAQKQQVKAILSKYNAATLTADQAKAIHEAFHQAGLRGGPAMADTLREAGFDPDKLRDLAPPPDATGDRDNRPQRPAGDRTRREDGRQERRGDGQQGRYTIIQAISDRAQLNTIAFSGLAFLTGDFGAATFMPPGKVCDFFGFQYMRDIDAAEKGHNPIFLTRIAGDVLHILNDQQRQMFADLAAEQAPQFEQLALQRMPLIEAFQREKDGKIPTGSPGLNREAVIRYVGDFYVFDVEMSYRRAEVFGQVLASLTADQQAAFAKMKFGDFNTWPDFDEREALKRPNPGSSRFFPVAYMTYASEFFSWSAGSVEADTYFCPERHGTYFGSFYMKDMPAMGKRNYDISTSVTGDSGEEFLNLLTAEQRGKITSIPDRQRKLLAETVEIRRAISVELRKFISGNKADKAKVLALGRRYGELDGEMSWIYATAFAKVGRTLTVEQRAACMKLRNLDGYHSAPAYLYSNPLQKLPAQPNSDFLFSSPAKSSVTPASATPSPAADRNAFTLRSPAFTNGGRLPAAYTGDGASITPPLEWISPPGGTKAFALIMHHIDPEGKTKWYWTLYNIPPDVRSLPANVQGIGILGNNSINDKVGYAPPHSKGLGDKTYVLTLYALSAPVQPSVAPAEVTRDVLLAAMEGKIMATCAMQAVYARVATASVASPEPSTTQ